MATSCSGISDEKLIAWDEKRRLLSSLKASTGGTGGSSRLTRSESDASILLSTLPTINEDLKDAKYRQENEDVFTLKRPVSCEVRCSSGFFLPPLRNQLNINTSRNLATNISCKRRPSTPRPTWSSSNSKDLQTKNRLTGSNLRDNIEIDAVDRDINDLITDRSLVSFVTSNNEIPLHETPVISPASSSRRISAQGNRCVKHTMLPKTALATSLNRQKMESNQITSTLCRKLR